MEYNFNEIEKKWHQKWQENDVYKVDIDNNRQKYYVLDMFPYPSGAGLHVGHPLGYIASDIYSRYKRQKGFNVLHPMGYDAFGLPAEQYAIQTGTHPAITTEKNIERYREQLDRLGFSYDWSREVKTCDPNYYKWTQWTFIQLFNSWYNKSSDKAEPISNLIDIFSKEGNAKVNACTSDENIFTAEQWNNFTETEQQEKLMNYRLAYRAESTVNWCTELGTVLANDEVSEGLSVRGGHPVERKKMMQWLLRISAYADRLLNGLEKLDWSESIKEIQRNWIGKSTGASVNFELENKELSIEVFTTRPDTIFGATFMVLAPEHDLVNIITTSEQKVEVEQYCNWVKTRTERERMTEVKKVSGAFTGAYAINPFTKKQVPIWISEYVLMGYGTGAIMAVPAHDSRDFDFAKHFNLPIIQVIKDKKETEEKPLEESYDAKDGILINSGDYNGMQVQDAIASLIEKIEKLNIGKARTNYRLRDAIFSRQRYWGEPFPIYYKDNMPYNIPETELPIELPKVNAYLPTEAGEPPLARAENWKYNGYNIEVNTMPGFAGSSAYSLRYMDPKNDKTLVGKEAVAYWQSVDLYVGGAEHATGHLLYSRFWNMFLFDIGVAHTDEPFKKMINQGMIQGRTNIVYRIKGENKFVSLHQKDNYDVQPLRVDVNIVDNDILNIESFRNWREEFKDSEFILDDGKYICGWEIEKMSKSFHNVVNPDNLIAHYGADTLRFYEMFLGPLEQAKPWDTNGIEGVSRFIKKFWRLFFDNEGNLNISNEEPTENELKTLHKTIQKFENDIERFSFNTIVSAFMICVNELSDLKCNKRAILEPLTILISSFAPHIAEELWQRLGHETFVVKENFPKFDPKALVESNFNYPVSFNGKTRFFISLPVGIDKAEVEKIVIEAPESQKWLDGKQVKKVIVVSNKIVNVVV